MPPEPAFSLCHLDIVVFIYNFFFFLLRHGRTDTGRARKEDERGGDGGRGWGQIALGIT